MGVERGDKKSGEWRGEIRRLGNGEGRQESLEWRGNERR